MIAMNREARTDWYIQQSSNIIWRGGKTNITNAGPTGHVVTLPIASYTFHQIRDTTGSVAKGINVVGFSDPHVLLRRQGNGI
jgi:hypothetical protein